MIQSLEMDEWRAFDKAHPAPTFFARPAWAQSIGDAYETLDPQALVVGKREVIVPGMLARGRAGFRELVAFPLGTYTAFLDNTGRPVSADVATATLQELQRHFDRVSLILWPLGPQTEANARGNGRVLTTAAIDCSDGFDAALGRMRGVTRRMAGQASRRGVTCRLGKTTELLAYYQMLHEAAAGQANRHLPPYALLESVLRRGEEHAQLWFAESDGVKIAGGIIFFGSDELFFWSAAMRREYAHLRPSNALNVALLEAACERGVRWYNLGASEGLGGVEQFKRGLGASDHAYEEVSLRAPMYTLYESLRSRIRPSWKM